MGAESVDDSTDEGTACFEYFSGQLEQPQSWRIIPCRPCELSARLPKGGPCSTTVCSVKRHPARLTLLESNGAGHAADSSGISSRGCSGTSATMVRGTRSSSRRSVARTCGLAWNARWKGWSNKASALASRIIP
jgi:hypothetical protein